MNWQKFTWNVVTLLILAVGLINLICLIYLLLPRYSEEGIRVQDISTQIGITQLVFSALGIGIAVLGFLGYKNIKESAVETVQKITDKDSKKANKKFAEDIEIMVRNELSRQLDNRLKASIGQVEAVRSESDLGSSEN
ncbi:MAG TPA: hypothetical protein PKC29_07480 [Thermodesulfobacteriota bacterium]|nr:hypothetical protein [Thermodesulfobacteriota bacterium]